MNNEAGNIFLTVFSWFSAIIASVFLDLSPFWETAVQLAPWASTFVLYLANFDKANKSIQKVWAFFIGCVRKK